MLYNLYYHSIDWNQINSLISSILENQQGVFFQDISLSASFLSIHNIQKMPERHHCVSTFSKHKTSITHKRRLYEIHNTRKTSL